MSEGTDPHAGRPVVSAGPPIAPDRPVLIMIHGRGASPRNILELVPRLRRPNLTCLAPAAANNTWYPLSFLSEREKNEPYLTSALTRVGQLVKEVVSTGVPTSRIVLLGFSQGACLGSEFVYRHPARYGGLIAFSGGLIGPPGTTWTADGSLAGTPAFFGCSDVDVHVPKSRVDDTARLFETMGADVTERIYPGMGHLINEDELECARSILDRVESA
jgi:predicted esterase